MKQAQRRRFLLAATGFLSAPRLLLAQPRDQKVYRLGFLGTAFASGYVRELEWIREGLADFGYAEGRNLLIEYRWGEGSAQRNREIAAEFVALGVDAILVHGLPGALAASRETARIPIVMADGGDPVAAGLAASIARPGGNVTGSFSFLPEEIGKRLQLLHEVLPRMKRVAFLASAADVHLDLRRNALAAAARAAGIQVEEFVINKPHELGLNFERMSAARTEALVVNNEPVLNSHARQIAELASSRRLPAIGYATFSDVGGLIAYGANRPALYRRVGYFVDRIFRGARPGDIPLERAAKFDTVVNLATAKSIGIKVPQTFLLRVDRVIQ